MAMERIGACKHAHFQHWQLDAFAIPIDLLARLQHGIDKARDRNGTAVTFEIPLGMACRRSGGTGETAQDHPFAARCTCAVVVPTKTEPAAR
ncbi:hypothetical protein D3C72_2041430 [compost metagenome]